MGKSIKKRIYFVRHGETDYNLNGLIQGRKINADLNETGRTQAQKLFTYYQDYPFQHVYISSLSRTYQTVIQFIKTGIPFTRLSGLDEMSYGRYEGKPIFQEGIYVFEEIRKKWEKGEFSASAPDGESLYDVVHRQKEALDYILSNDMSPILVCMHGRALKILLSWLTDRDYILMDEFEMPNTAVYILEYDYNSTRFEIKESCTMVHLQESFREL